jgi:5-methylcytosine-specific restriction endonuclease McrA
MTKRLRAQVRRRARGRCEYCQTPFRYDVIPAEIDHVIAEQHGGRTVLDNLAAACAHCNSHKGPNAAGVDPSSKRIVRLFNPRVDRWADHFRWVEAVLTGIPPQGRTTIRVLAINDPAKTAARAALMEEGLF